MTRLIPLRPVPPQAPPRRVSYAALELLEQSRQGLLEAATVAVASERYAIAHLAALRAAAAVLADRAQPSGAGGLPWAGVRGGPTGVTVSRRRRLRSAWELLHEVAPELGEWADFFAAGAAKRAAAEAGVRSAATPREADDLIRDADRFLRVVMETIGVGEPARPRPGFRLHRVAG